MKRLPVTVPAAPRKVNVGVVEPALLPRDGAGAGRVAGPAGVSGVGRAVRGGCVVRVGVLIVVVLPSPGPVLVVR
jgi:hypothetical protein